MYAVHRKSDTLPRCIRRGVLFHCARAARITERSFLYCNRRLIPSSVLMLGPVQIVQPRTRNGGAPATRSLTRSLSRTKITLSWPTRRASSE